MTVTHDHVQIDGSLGEGGGQILRTSLSLSVISGRAFHITKIRSSRKKPGLMAQHLAAVDAAAEISAARLEGATLHSTELSFIPTKIKSGRYKFNIQTAGSSSLVLQTIFLPLSRAGSASSFQITGGTHVPWSPCYHYLALQWLPYLLKIGFDADLTLEKAGFFPQGGGQVRGTIRPAASLTPLEIEQRGKLLSIEGISAVANLKTEIAERQKRQALGRLLKSLIGLGSLPIRIRIVELSSYGKGTFLLLKGNFENGSCCFFSLGEIGKPAERVADEAVDEFLRFLETDGAVDPYLADQLMLPLILTGGTSRIRTSEISAHLLTNAAVLDAFRPGCINIQGHPGKSGTIVIHPWIG